MYSNGQTANFTDYSLDKKPSKHFEKRFFTQNAKTEEAIATKFRNF
ncbi:hypothetical protein T11_6343 [Trichinella zimbabwensis]|uniref:Uncharacterized protein n=1 Tax=Trichinella zimbabwensis TaxID=268475 RepID=A0A0V1GER0_9BILA|nr:hypothetical protein T11_6343 [Trichinella zimbabwensis]